MEADRLIRFRAERDEFFRGSPHSPLTPAQQQTFGGLRYFEANPALDLVLTPEALPDGGPIDLQTTSGEVQRYQRHARIRFTVDGQPAVLTIFRGEHGFFLPFADGLAGRETYGAGRYLEPEELPDGRFAVDFNLAYNPYCAYNENWSCPLTPAENRLAVPIRAGERLFESQADSR